MYVPDDGGHVFYSNNCFPTDAPFILPKRPLDPAQIDGIIAQYAERWKTLDQSNSPLQWWMRTRTRATDVLDRMCPTCKMYLVQRRDMLISSNDPKKSETQTDRNELDLRLVLHIQNGECPDARRAEECFGIPVSLPLRETGDIPDYIHVTVAKHVEVVEPLPEPDADDEIKTDLVIPEECLAKPLFWRRGDLHPDVANREKTILKGSLLAFLGDGKPEQVWLAEVLEIRTYTLDIAWYWRDPDTDQWRIKPEDTQRVKHAFGTWLHWNFKLTQKRRLPQSVMACIENHDRFYRRRQYKKHNKKHYGEAKQRAREEEADREERREEG